MKKILFLIVAVLPLYSCVVSRTEKPRRTAENLKSTASFFANYSVDIPSGMINNCMLANDFIKAGEEERKKPKYSSVSYTPATNTFDIGTLDKIETSGMDFSTVSTVWTVTRSGEKILVECIGENQWTVSRVSNGTDDYWKGLAFSSSFILVSKDADGFCTWQCNMEGVYNEDDNYSTSFSSPEGLTVKWDGQYTGASVYARPVFSGVISSKFYVDGKETDWCTLTYENSKITKTLTSQD